MRLVKIFGLAAMASLLATAFIGTSSSSAFWNYPTLCEINVQLCPVSYQHPLFQALTSEAENVSLIGAVKEKCASSKIEDSTYEEGATESVLYVTLEKMTFSGCEPCTTVTATGAPSEWEMLRGSEVGNGVFMVSVEAALSGCPLGAKCTFVGKGLELDFKGSSTKPTYEAKEEKVSLVSGSKLFCGESATWTATYVETGLPHLFLAWKREYML